MLDMFALFSTALKFTLRPSAILDRLNRRKLGQEIESGGEVRQRFWGLIGQ